MAFNTSAPPNWKDGSHFKGRCNRCGKIGHKAADYRSAPRQHNNANRNRHFNNNHNSNNRQNNHNRHRNNQTEGTHTERGTSFAISAPTTPVNPLQPLPFPLQALVTLLDLDNNSVLDHSLHGCVLALTT